jgi:N utilization substance protein B
VVLDEAIEVARRFGTNESAVFVNGVLDQIAEQLGVKGAAGERSVPDDG